MQIAIIGTGISGLGAAYILNKQHDITVYEKNDYIGGHSRTVQVKLDGQTIPVDTGFIVYNDRNYPLLTELFDHLNVPFKNTSMSFGISVLNGSIEYGTESLLNIFGQKKNIFRLSFWKMLQDILKFNKRANTYLESASSVTLGQCLEELGMGDWFRRYYLLPMGGAIWSSSLEQMLNFPAKTFIRFFENHGLLTVNNQPQWRTVKGGSQEYVTRLINSYKDKILLSCGVKKIIRDDTLIRVIDYSGDEKEYDHVVFACHPDQALNLLTGPTDMEKDILGSFEYQENAIVMHSDPRYMPRSKSCWSSWVYTSNDDNDGDENIALTYWMNNLQPLETKHDIFVSLNSTKLPEAHHIHDQYIFEHPVFNKKAIDAQDSIHKLQGVKNTWYCGAYQRYGFHEDGLWSAVRMTEMMGVKRQWS